MHIFHLQGLYIIVCINNKIVCRVIFMNEISIVIDYVKIGKKIKQIRISKGLTQEEIATAAEISLSHMSNIETAKTKVSLKTLAKISRILECSLDELVFDDKITSNFKLTHILRNADEFEINITEVLIKAIEDNKIYLKTNKKGDNI